MLSNIIVIGYSDPYYSYTVRSDFKYLLIVTFAKYHIAFHGIYSLVTCMLASGPMLWYDESFDATDLRKNIEVNSMGTEIIWGNMFLNHDMNTQLKLIKCPIFLAKRIS